MTATSLATELSPPTLQAPLPYGPEEPNVLCYYDGPHLAWVGTHGAFDLLGMALPEVAGSKWPFLVFALTSEQRHALESDQITLRAAVLEAAGHWFLSDYGAPQEAPLASVLELPEDWLPGDVTLHLPQ